MSELENGFRIGDVVAMVRRRLPIVVGASLLGAVVGYTMFAGTPETFSATASVQVAPIRIDQFSEESRSEVDIATERALVKSDAVAETVRDELGLEGDNRAILRRIVVVNDLDSLVLRISYDGDTADQAKRGADAAAKGYLDQRKDNATSTRDAAVARLNEEIAAAETAAQDASTRLDATLDGTPERAAARTRLTNAESTRDTLIEERTRLNGFDPETVGALVRAASVPEATTSKMALGKGVGVFGLFVLAGLAIAWFFDRRDGLGGGRRRIEAIVPGANLRVMPGAAGANASPAEVDTAIDRLAVELVAGGSPGKPASVLVIGAGIEPPMALAEELASSLTFAGIPALFVLAGTSDREVRHAHVVGSFEALYAEYTPHFERPPNREEVWRHLLNTRKSGKLPKLGDAKSAPPETTDTERNLVKALLGNSLGKRDRLPYTKPFDEFVKAFNSATRRRLTPHQLWRLVAVLAK